MKHTAKVPGARAFRLVGAAARTTLPIRDDGDAVAVSLGADDAKDVATVARALPDPASLPEGMLVVVLPSIGGASSLASRVLAAVRGGKSVSRARRCSALLARGYARIGAGTGAAGDLAWGFATGPC